MPSAKDEMDRICNPKVGINAIHECESDIDMALMDNEGAIAIRQTNFNAISIKGGKIKHLTKD